MRKTYNWAKRCSTRCDGFCRSERCSFQARKAHRTPFIRSIVGVIGNTIRVLHAFDKPFKRSVILRTATFDRKCKRECGTNPFTTFEMNFALMTFNDALDDKEPESRTLCLHTDHVISAKKLRKNPVLLTLWNPGSSIFNGKSYLIFIL